MCLYCIGLNPSNVQIGQEFGLDADSAHDMATQLRNGILAKEPEVVLSDEVVINEKCRNISPFFNSFTTTESVEKHSFNHSSSDYSHDLPEIPDEPSLIGIFEGNPLIAEAVSKTTIVGESFS